MTALELLDRAVGIEGLSEHLDSLSSAQRVGQMLALDGARQKSLFELAAGGKKLQMESLVPAGRVREEVVFHGRNSMPLFSSFQKRLFRAADGGLFGYNRQGMSWLTGPGYFAVAPSPRDDRELLFDYTRVPAQGPTGGPEVRTNEGLAGPFFGGLHDYIRRVSDDCLIGWAYKNGSDLRTTFLLVR